MKRFVEVGVISGVADRDRRDLHRELRVQGFLRKSPLLPARVLRDVGEIGGQSWRGHGRRLDLGSIGVGFDHFVNPRVMRLTSGELRLVR
jgi:hypothetical protein